MIRFRAQPTIGDVFRSVSPHSSGVWSSSNQWTRVYMKVNAKFYVLVYKFSLYDCSGAHLLKVPVIIGPKMLFFRYQQLWNWNIKKFIEENKTERGFEEYTQFLRLRSVSSGNHWSEDAVFQISIALKFKPQKIYWRKQNRTGWVLNEYPLCYSLDYDLRIWLVKLPKFARNELLG